MSTNLRRTSRRSVPVFPTKNVQKMSTGALESGKKERAEIFLKDFVEEGNNRLREMDEEFNTISKQLKLHTKTMIQSLPMHIRKMTCGEFLGKGGDLNKLTMVSESVVNKRVNLESNKKLRSVQRTKSASETRERPKIDSMTHVKKPREHVSRSTTKFGGSLNDLTFSSASSQTLTFTPKFDPRYPKTIGSGFRSIKPGEKFVLMSMTGSPLGTVPTSTKPSSVITLDDGKSMTIPMDQVDQESMNNLEMLQMVLQPYVKSELDVGDETSNVGH